MFGRKKRRGEGVRILEAAAPVSGRLLPLRGVGDDVFAQGHLGQGIAIEPYAGLLTAPFDGYVAHVADAGHALLLEHVSGLQLLLHVGINTVELKGRGFKPLVRSREPIRTGQALLEFDLGLIRQSGYPAYVMAIAVGLKPLVQVLCDYREVAASEPAAFRLLISAGAERGE